MLDSSVPPVLRARRGQVEGDAGRGNPAKLQVEASRAAVGVGKGREQGHQKLYYRRPQGQHAGRAAFGKMQKQTRRQREKNEKSCQH